jgi:uncharacterized protein (TIGR03085 family)
MTAPTPRPTLAARERRALADSLLATGPDAPTLCEGWTTRDLARHLVLREGDPQAVARLAVAHAPALRGRLPGTDGPSRPYAELVERFRSGPALGAVVPKAVDALVNTAEHFIHHEDVRRAQPGWTARLLDLDDEKALWGPTLFMARRSYLRCPVGVVLVVPDGPRSKVRRGVPAVVLTGLASELVLYVTGRRPQADVQVSGPDDAVAAFEEWLAR